MFFRREVQRPLSFAQKLERLGKAGFQVESLSGGRARVSRGDCAALVADDPVRVTESGPLMGGEIGKLVDVGYQKLFETPGGRRTPALASQLKKMHAFLEDLREGLQLPSLYNESLGTVNTSHRYDRVEDRDSGVPVKPWEL